jgi:hypothetical protein
MVGCTEEEWWGDLSTYRDHVVRLTEGMPGFEGLIPFFDEEEGRLQHTSSSSRTRTSLGSRRAVW